MAIYKGLDVLHRGIEAGGAEVVQDLGVLGNIDFEGLDRAAVGGAGARAEGRGISDRWRADAVLDAVILLEEQCSLGCGESGTRPEWVFLSAQGAGMGELAEPSRLCGLGGLEHRPWL